MEEVKDVEGSTAAYCLSLPGKTLFLSHLLSLKKFRKRGNKDGALRAFFKLEEEGLGKVLEVAGSKGSQCVSSCNGPYCMCAYTALYILYFVLSNTSSRKLQYQTLKRREFHSQTNWENTTYL